MRPARARRGFASGAWFVMVVTLLLAVSWQSFVIQTHRHVDPAVSTIASALTVTAPDKIQLPGKKAPVDLPTNCSICRATAHAGHALLPAPVAIEAPVFASYWITQVTPQGLTLAGRSHAWHSRAPPSLQA